MRFGSNAPPLPENPYFLPQYPLGGGRWLVDDRHSAHPILSDTASASGSGTGGGGFQADDEGPPGTGGAGTNGTPFVVTNTYPLYNYGSNTVWLEITGITNSYIYLALHGPISNYVQLQYSTNLAFYHQTNWTPGETDNIGLPATAATNILHFQPVYMGFSQMFFRAQISGALASVVTVGSSDAVRPAPGVSVVDAYYNVEVGGSGTYEVNFSLTGSATEGIDYTNLPSPWTVNNSGGLNYIPVSPLAITNTDIVFDENVVMTLQPGINYLVDPTKASATVYIDQTLTNSFFELVTSNLYYPNGLAYHPLINALVVACGGVDSGSNVDFVRIGTNGAITPWTSLNFPMDEANPVIIQTNLGGFTNNTTFFTSGINGNIGWISTNGLATTTNWLTLSGETFVPVGGLYADTTGIFSNNLIAVMGDLIAGRDGNIWCISSNKTARLLTTLTNLGADGGLPSLEGVITTPNDPVHCGPWAARLLAGSEEPPAIFAVDTNGVSTMFGLGIQVEDIHIIAANQDFYINYVEQNLLLKLPRTLLTNYVGDFFITQEGLTIGSEIFYPKLYILHWDASSNSFIRRRLHPPNSATTGGEFEQGTFAPISIPATPVSDLY